MGRKRLPTQLKVMRGTSRPCRTDFDEPDPGANDVVKPDNLSDVASKHWDEVLRQLLAAGVMSNLDAAALALYCDAYGRYVDANLKLEEDGMLCHAASGHQMPNPYVNISNKAFDQMAKLLTEFGMTPSSRSKVSSSKTKTKAAAGNRFAS